MDITFRINQIVIMIYAERNVGVASVADATNNKPSHKTAC